MSNEQLRESLEQLRSEIDTLKEDAGDVKERANQLLGTIERQLEEDDSLLDHVTLVKDARGMIEQFEVEHPRITGVLNQIMLALSNMGI